MNMSHWSALDRPEAASTSPLITKADMTVAAAPAHTGFLARLA